MIRAWREDQFRREWNARAVDIDRAGCLVLLLLCTVSSVYKLWLCERQADLALLCGAHALLALAIAAACTYPPSRRIYVEHRELIVSLASLHCAFMCRRISTNGRTNVFTHHGGSPLRLLGLLLIGDFFIFGVLHHLVTRLSFAWTCVALPMAVLLPLVKEQSICHRVVAVPDIEAPLRDLHAVLRMVHDFATLTPASRQPDVYASSSPLEQCFAIDTWLQLVAGIALPLSALGALERNARRLFYRRQRQQHWEASAGAVDSGAHEGWVDDCEPSDERLHEWLLHSWQSLFQSAVAWSLAGVAAAVWLRGGSQPL